MALPLSRQEVLQFCVHLPEFEAQEVWLYFNKGVYFLGLGAPKLSFHARRNCFGKFSHLRGLFDSRDGFYRPILGDHIKYRYQILEVLGQGSYGTVVRAYDYKTTELFAIKIVRRYKYSDIVGTALGEIKVYNFVNLSLGTKQLHLGTMVDYFTFRGHVCIVLQLCNNDLLKELTNNKYAPFREPQLKTVARSILAGLRQLHKINLSHCDIKLDNVAFLRGQKQKTMVIDLGNSKFGVQQCVINGARCFAAPEVLMHLPFGPGTDMWALGCLLYRLATGKPLFRSTSPEDQLSAIMEVFGMPPNYMIRDSHVSHIHFTTSSTGIYTILPDTEPHCSRTMRGPPGSRDIFYCLKAKNPRFVEFLRSCFEWDPNKRLTCESAFYHSWLFDREFIPDNPQPSKTKAARPSASYPSLLKPIKNVPTEEYYVPRRTTCTKIIPHRSLSWTHRENIPKNLLNWLTVQAQFVTKYK